MLCLDIGSVVYVVFGYLDSVNIGLGYFVVGYCVWRCWVLDVLFDYSECWIFCVWICCMWLLWLWILLVWICCV